MVEFCGCEMLCSPTVNLLSSEYLLAAVIFYNWYVPEEERHDSAVKRNKEALITELKLWEGYLEKVALIKDTKSHIRSECILMFLLLSF